MADWRELSFKDYCREFGFPKNLEGSVMRCKNCEQDYEEPCFVLTDGHNVDYGCTCGSYNTRIVHPIKIKKKLASKGKYIDIQNEVIEKHRVKVSAICVKGSRRRMHSHVKERRVCKWVSKNSIASTFDLFHEIGHIETTTSKMRRCEEEYFATVWAIEKCHEYGLEIPDTIIRDYQRYIDMERDRGVRRGGKHYPSLEELKLHK